MNLELHDRRALRDALILRARRFMVALRPHWALIIVLSSLVSACAKAPTNPPTVHRYAGGPDEMYANAYIIEGESGTVVVDALLTRTASRELRKRVDAFGKPLRAVIVTHGHPDHYGGITQLVDGLDDVSVVAIRGVDRVIRRDDALKAVGSQPSESIGPRCERSPASSSMAASA